MMAAKSKLVMLYFTQTTEPIWLSTSLGTRAENFYRRQGWQETGHTSSGEVRFELSKEAWKQRLASDSHAR